MNVIDSIWDQILKNDDLLLEMKNLNVTESPCMFFIEVDDDKCQCKLLYTKKESGVWNYVIEHDSYVRDITQLYDPNSHILVGLTVVSDQDSDERYGSFRLYTNTTFEKVIDSVECVKG